MSWVAIIARLVASFPELVKVFYEIRRQMEQEAVRRVHSNNARDIDQWMLDQSDSQPDTSTSIKGKGP